MKKIALKLTQATLLVFVIMFTNALLVNAYFNARFGTLDQEVINTLINEGY